MKQSLRFASLLLAMLFIASLVPAKALADEFSPYESVETLEDGVVLYHNKDGSYTMVVGATTDGGKGAGTNRVRSADKPVENEVQVQIEKLFREGSPLATIEYAGGSLSFFPIADVKSAEAPDAEQSEAISKEEDAKAEAGAEAAEEDEKSEEVNAKKNGDGISNNGETEAGAENGSANGKGIKEDTANGKDALPKDEEPTPEAPSTDADPADHLNSPNEEEQASGTPTSVRVSSFAIPKDEEGNPLPLAETVVPANTEESEIPFPKDVEALDAENKRIAVPVSAWKVYEGAYGDAQAEWVFFPVFDESKILFAPELSEAMEKDVFSALPHVVIRRIEEDADEDSAETSNGLFPAETEENSDEEGAADQANDTVSDVTEEDRQSRQNLPETEGASVPSANGDSTAASKEEENAQREDEDATLSPDQQTTYTSSRRTVSEQEETHEPTVIQGIRDGSDAVVYEDVFCEGTGIRLRATENGIKEDILIGSYVPEAQYRYQFQMDGFTPVLQGQTVALYRDSEQAGTILAPYMTDATGAYCDRIDVSLYGKGDGIYELVYTPDDGWLGAAERAYPVVLDPTVEVTVIGTSTDHMEDNHVSKSQPNRQFTYKATEIKAGGDYIAYIRPRYLEDLAKNNVAILIKEATLHLYCKSGSGTLNVHQVQGEWSSRTITYNNKPSYANEAFSSIAVQKGKVDIDITKPFSSWFHSIDQAGSFGVALEGQKEITFASADTPINRMVYSATYYVIEEANTLKASPTVNADQKTGYVDLTWDAIPNASGYYVGIHNGKIDKKTDTYIYEYFYAGNVTSWSTKGRNIWPTEAEIAAGRYNLHLDETGGAELPINPAPTYEKAGSGNESLAYYFDIRPANQYGQAANLKHTRPCIFPQALVPSQPSDVKVSPSTWTNASTVTVSWSGIVDHLVDGTLLKELEAGGQIQYRINNSGAWKDTGSRAVSGSFEMPVSAVSSGEHVVSIRAKDKDGNEGTARDANFRIDRQGPNLKTLFAEPEYTKDTAIRVTWSDLTDQGCGTIGKLEYRIDNGAWTGVKNAKPSGSITVPVTSLSAGAHTVSMRGTDTLGNIGTAVSAGFTKDTTAPSMSELAVIPSEWTNETEATIGWSGLSDTQSGVKSLHCTVDGKNRKPLDHTQAEGSVTISLEGLSDGEHTVVLEYADAVGNTGSKTATVYRDTTPPAVEGVTVTPDGWSSEDKIELAWQGLSDAHAGVATLQYTVDDGDAVPLDANLPDGSVEIETDALADGAHTVRLVYRDHAQNEAETVLPFYRDITAPMARLIQPANGDLVNGIVNVTGTAMDQTALQSWELRAVGASGAEVVVASGTENKENTLLGVLDTGVFADGEEIALTLAVTDRAGNTQVTEGTVIKVDKSMTDIAASLSLIAPQNGEIITDAVYRGEYSGETASGRVYVDGKAYLQAEEFAFEFTALQFEEESSHTFSILAEDEDGVLSYSEGFAALVIGSDSPNTEESYLSEPLDSLKPILALRLHATASEEGSIAYFYSTDDGATWNGIVPEKDVRVLGEVKRVWLKAEPQDGAVLYGWDLSAIIEKAPAAAIVRLNGTVTPFSLTQSNPLQTGPIQTIETDLSAPIASRWLYADGISVNDTDFAYETLRTEERGQVALAALALGEDGTLYASGTPVREQLLRENVQSEERIVLRDALQLSNKGTIYAVRLLAKTQSEGCRFYVSADGETWIEAETEAYTMLPQGAKTFFLKAEQTEENQLLAWSLEGIGTTDKVYTVRLIEQPKNPIVKDYGKFDKKRYELSWTKPDAADADMKYVVYKNGAEYAVVSTTAFVDAEYDKDAVYSVSARKTYSVGAAAYTTYPVRESEAVAAQKQVMEPPQKPVVPSTPSRVETEDAPELEYHAITEREDASYLFTPDMLEPKEGPKLDQKLLGKNKYCSLGFEPVNFNTGNFFLETADYAQADIGRTVSILRTYNAQSTVADGPFGEKWAFPYGQFLELYTSGSIGYRNAAGALTVFTPDGAGGFTGNDEDYLVLTEDRIRGEYTVLEKDKTKIVFEKKSGWLVRIEDRNGNALRLHRAKTGYLNAIELASGAVLSVTTDNKGHITEVQLPDRTTLRYAYDGNRLTSFTDQNGHTTRYEYDAKGRMTAWHDALGVCQVRNTYDENDRVVFQTDGLNGEYRLEYFADHTVVTDALGKSSEIRFDSLHRTIREVNAQDASVEYFYDENNNLVGTTDADGKLTSSEYDARGNHLKNTLPDGSTGAKTYDGNDNLTSYTDGNGHTTSYTYDERGNVLTTTDALGNVTRCTYNEKGQVISVTDALGGVTTYAYRGANVIRATDANGHVTTYDYDAAGRLVKATDALKKTTTYTYDATGRLIGVRYANGAVTRYAYDAVGNCIQATDALGNATAYEYDALRRPIATVYADGARERAVYDLGGNVVSETDALGNTATYTYDAVGNLLTITDAENNRTEYAYDRQNRVTRETLPTGAVRTYAYDPNSGLVTETTDARGIATALTYDKAGNVLSRTQQSGAATAAEYDALNRVIRQTDANGGVTSYRYDALGRVIEQTNALGGVTRYGYDAVGNLTETTDALGNTTKAKYDALNRLVSVTDPAGATTTYAYDAVGNLTSVTDPLGNKQTYTYDPNGNPVEQADATGARQRHTYDKRGRLVSVLQKDGGKTQIGYDALGNVTETTDALGAVTRYAYNAFGQTTEVIDALGQTAKMQYDALGKTTRVTSPDGTFTRYAYDAAGRLLSVTDPLGAASAYTYDAAGNLSTVRENGSETRYHYDKAGNIVGLTDAEGRAVAFAYDAMGNLTETRYPDGTKATNAYDVMGRLIESVPRHGVKTSYAYDAAGRVTKVTEGERETHYAYDLAGNVTKAMLPDGSETAYRYDANNNPIRVIDALGSETSYRYDTMGRLLSVRQPNGATLRLRYDLAGNLTQETDAMGGKQVYAYDAIGRLTEVTDALGGTTRYGYDALDNLTLVTDANGHETRYAYDPLSRLRTETDARGNTTAYDYTPEGWLKQTTRPDGTTLSYVYDKTGYLLKETASDGTEIRHTFDALGELTEIADETGTTKLRYDERGLLIGVENPLGDVVQYTYNAYGEKIGITYPDGKQATYTYDALSRLLSVTEPNGTTTEYTYDALGRRTSTTDGTAKTEYRYDKVGNLTRQTNDAVTLTYKYDQNSRMIGETREEGKTVTRTNYAYDKAGQLTSFRRSDGNAERYKYDPAGNMVEKTQNGVKIAMTYTAANELQSMESPHGKLVYAYDQNGNLTQKTYNNRTDTYSYDARNHLRQYRGYDNYTVKYSYNALGMLHAKESTGSNSRTTLEELIAGKEGSDDPDGDGDKPRTTTYVYDLTQPYYEVLTESTDGRVTSYTYGIERLAAYTESTKTAYLYDGRGSVIQTNGESKYYSPFGELLSEKVSGYGFNGEYYDAATGMLNLRARQYEPVQARFSQKDSEKGYVANARSLNAYLYCYNDGVNYFDADGAKPEVVRNNTTVDPGGGGSSAARIASTAQNGASANTVANTSPTKSAATGAKVANHAAVSIGYAEKGSESSAVSDAQLEYAFKQGRMPTVGDNSILKEATKGACTDIPHGGHSGKFGPFGSHGGHSCEIPVLMGAYEDTTLFGSIVEGAINAIQNISRKFPQHEATVDATLAAIGNGARKDREYTGIPGAGPKGGYGYPDIKQGAYVWEIKPDTPYGHRSGKKQMDRYTKDNIHLAGYIVNVDPIPYLDGHIYVTSGREETGDAGVVYYKFQKDPIRRNAAEPNTDHFKILSALLAIVFAKVGSDIIREAPKIHSPRYDVPYTGDDSGVIGDILAWVLGWD